MRICIDLDGVIAELKKENETYTDVKPIPGAVEKIKKLKENGHYIIIYTARHMKTCDGNVAKVISKIGKITLEWLEKYQVPYDEIVFGKPWADIYIDDNGFRFKNWDEISYDGSNLPVSSEKRLRGDE
jgi:capsule biosynthesis phosphatase